MMLSNWIPPISLGARTLFRRKWNPNPIPKIVTLQWFSFSSSKAPIDMAARDGELRVFLVAGEVSGDSIASRLMASLKLFSPFPLRFAGVGGHVNFFSILCKVLAEIHLVSFYFVGLGMVC